MVVSILAMVPYLALLYTGLAVGAKRLHGRNKSAWRLLAFYALPIMLSAVGGISGSTGVNLVLGLTTLTIGIWGFVELGCMGGTNGPSQYGPDPIPETPERPR